jgi:hypothetical protein
MNLLTEPLGLVYASCPSRLTHLKEQIMQLFAEQGKGCLHPFNALPYEYFEGGVVGREKSLKLCCRLLHVCEEFSIFGVSEGTLLELEYWVTRNSKHVRSLPMQNHVLAYDPEWRKYREQYYSQFPLAFSVLNLPA